MDVKFCAKAAGTPFNVNQAEQKTSAVPRHQEIKTMTARHICRDLRVPEPLGA